MTACDACAIAEKRPLTGRYTIGCRECMARALAHSPQMADALEANAITSEYRAALESAFGEGWQEGHERVKAWQHRIGHAQAATAGVGVSGRDGGVRQ